ncbi:MAG TPA: PAS domain S-box protein, partial [Candidatus Dormibacteraeota bacterium]|nr:PAS domain S-box protein [Candidatus Dormibacteraeota bacterium]
MGQGYVSGTRILVRRAAPFVAIAAVFAIQALVHAQAILAFPLYLAVVLVVALQQDLVESLAVAAAAAVATLVQVDSWATGLVLAPALVGIALGMGALSRRARATNLEAQRKLDALRAAEQSLRTTLESAEVGLAVADLDGRLLQVNASLARLFGRGREELRGLSL